MRASFAGAWIGVFLWCSASAAAQGGPPRSVVIRRAAALDDTTARLVATWRRPGGREESDVTIALLDADPIELHRGGAAMPAIAAGHGRFVVAMAHAGRQPFVRVRIVAPRGDGAPEVSRAVDLRPDGDAQWAPTSVVACEDPDGFTVLWQEENGGNRFAARAFLARVSPEGRVTRRAWEAPIGWALGAMAWNGAGYHLALFFDQGAIGQTRLSMVSITREGTPEQHPDWASAMGRIEDVQLVRARGHILAFYRGGPDGQQLLEADVTQIRNWGADPPAAASHGPIANGEDYVVRIARDGTAHPTRVASR